jgi:hypothetical protein
MLGGDRRRSGFPWVEADPFDRLLGYIDLRPLILILLRLT